MLYRNNKGIIGNKLEKEEIMNKVLDSRFILQGFNKQIIAFWQKEKSYCVNNISNNIKTRNDIK